MRPPIADHQDPSALGDVPIDCSTLPDLARQEFKADSDVNTIVNRFKRGVIPLTFPVQYGERDFELDLQAGLEAQRRLGEAFRKLPAEVRGRYVSWEEVAQAVARGDLEFVKDSGVEAPAGSSAGGSAPAASESAPV